MHWNFFDVSHNGIQSVERQQKFTQAFILRREILIHSGCGIAEVGRILLCRDVSGPGTSAEQSHLSERLIYLVRSVAVARVLRGPSPRVKRLRMVPNSLDSVPQFVFIGKQPSALV